MNLVYFIGIGVGIRTASGPLIELTHRLQLRAVKLSLGELFANLRDQLDLPVADTDRRDAQYSEAMVRFIDIQNQLLPCWRNRTSFLSAGKVALLYLLLIEAIAEIVFVATGSCLTLWPLSSSAAFLIMMIPDLLNISSSNSKLNEMSEVYRLTRNRIRELVWLASRSDEPRNARVMTDLAHLDDLLSAYSDLTQCQGRFLGFVVTYGFTRSLVVSLFTVCLGFWTLLRGLGITFTQEIACQT
jgi:hypothetical protein